MKMNISLAELWLITPIIVLFLTSLIPITIKVLKGNKEQPEFASAAIAAIGIITAGIFASTTWMGTARTEAFQGALVFDGLASWTTMIILFITLITLLFSMSHSSIRGNQFSEHVFLVMNAAIGMLVLAWSNDLIITFIAMELMSLALYVLIGISHEQRLAKEAAFKYFILGSLGSAIFLYGVAIVYGGAESTSFSRLIEVAPAILASNRFFLLGIVLILAGICFKTSLFPFHSWTPDVYQGSPTPITGFMATGVKLVMFVVFLRLVLAKGLSNAGAMMNTLQWVAVLTMFAGNLAAIRQNNLKRMLAYSSIAHSGYTLIGLITVAIGNEGGVGASSVLFYLLVYAVMNLGAFGLVSLYEKTEETAVQINDLKGLAYRRPGLALAMTVLMLSLAGIPPTAGFFSKFYIFSAAVNEGLYWLAIWGVISSVIGVYYYLRPVVNMYMYESDARSMDVSNSAVGRMIIAVTAVVIIVVGLISNPIFRAIYDSVKQMFV